MTRGPSGDRVDAEVFNAKASNGSGGRHGGAFLRRTLLLCPALLTAAVTLSAINTRALWIDEAYTALASTKSWQDLFTLVTQVNDIVHAIYYAVMHVVLDLFGVSEMTLRLPSALAMSAACLATTLIGYRAVSLRMGILAGFTFALLPITMDYGTEGRSYAFSVALVAWTSWALARQGGARDIRVAGWIVYGALLTITGLVFMYGWLISLAHVVTLAISSDMPRRVRAAGVGAIATSAILLSPFWWAAIGQSGQVAWIRRDTVAELEAVATLAFDRSAATLWWPFLAFIAVMLWGTVRALSTDQHSEGTQFLIRLAWPWFLLPGLILVLASLIRPTFTDRYITFTVPAAALLLGLAMDRMSVVWRSATAIALVTVGALSYMWLFTPGGRDGWGIKDQLLVKHARSGDGVYFSSAIYGIVGEFAGLPDGLVLVSDETGALDPISAIGELKESASIWVVPFTCVLPEDQALLEDLEYRPAPARDGTGPCTAQEFVRDPQSN